VKESIIKILEELEKQSILEKSRSVNITPENRMLAITKETGELLNTILRLKKAKNMLEIGMSVGYSTIWCAEALVEQQGKIITIEQNLEKIKKARENFQRSELEETITIKQGSALETLIEFSTQPQYNNFFDFIFIDADKENIVKYFDLVYPMLTVGGIIITDNMRYPKKYRPLMKKFSDHIKTNPNVRTVTSPIGNGEEITIKIR